MNYHPKGSANKEEWDNKTSPPSGGNGDGNCQDLEHQNREQGVKRVFRRNQSIKFIMTEVSGDRKVIGNNSQNNTSQKHADINGYSDLLKNIFESSGKEYKKPAYSCGCKTEEDGVSKIKYGPYFVTGKIPHRTETQVDNKGKYHITGTTCHESRDDGLVILYCMFMVQYFQRKQATS